MEAELQKLIDKHGAEFVVNNLLQMARGPSKDRAFALLAQIAGRTFDSQKAWVDWWKENKRDFPELRAAGDPDKAAFDKLVQEVVRATERRKKPRPAPGADETIAHVAGTAPERAPAPAKASPPGRPAPARLPPAPVGDRPALPNGWTRERPTLTMRRRRRRFQYVVLVLLVAVAAVILSDVWLHWISK